MPHILTIKHKRGKPGAVYYPLQLKAVPKPGPPGPGEVLIRMAAAALNHRDHFIRQHLYPNISFESPLFSDACGTVVEVGPGCKRSDELLNKLVVLVPYRGWDGDSPDGPEDWSAFATVGGTEPYRTLGGGQTWMVAAEDQVEVCPPHLSAVEGAALPSCGVTAWRALVTKCGRANVGPGRNILITGIGGGVALQALQMALALGANVYVTSGSEAKLARARQLGAKGGALYTEQDWPKIIAGLLPLAHPLLDAIVDGAGGDIVIRAVPILKPGGVIAIYGMTTAPVLDWPMQAVLKNIELRGTTLGSRAEFRDMVAFVAEHKLRPVISRTVKGLDCVDAIDGLFEDLKGGKQFGKLVIEI
uniref:Trans-acting enoylreductase n=2 Tax=Pseudophialophora TaxID=1524836 RepID=A0AC62AEJ9_9PEZI